MELKNKSVVITGGSKGFGKALAEAFLKEGARVMICSVEENTLEATAKEIGASFFVADVTKEEDMNNLLQETLKQFGSMDIWINNAGLWMAEANADSSYMDKVRKMFEVNVFGLMNGSRTALQYMEEKNAGTIINILSVAGVTIRPEITAYSASKWAGTGFTRAIREKVKEKNILILAVFPGGMKTTLFGDYKYANFENFMDPKNVAQKVIDNLKLEKPEEEIIIKREEI
ncbi:MAG: SDR family oxidoreductase [Candidatus Paceibacterota bacterium]|jgi:NADP-dependent 3-hydroxy acid dehydrogenase YdfG